MIELKFALWNCSGLRASAGSTAQKMGYFDKLLPEADFAVAVFVETHHREERDFPPLIHEYISTHHYLHSPTPPDRSHCAIVLLIHKQFTILRSQDVDPGRWINVHFKHADERLPYNLSFYYGPQIKTFTSDDMA